MKVLRQISKSIGSYRFLIFYTIGLQVTQEALDEVATLSCVTSVGDDYLPSSVREKCERIVPNIDGVKPAEAADAYLFLKAQFEEPAS